MQNMITFIRTDEFDHWLEDLRDVAGKARIALRIRNAEQGHFGDCASVGDGVTEMRIHCGPGYRLYFARCGEVIYLLLLGGDKSTQQHDIKRAKALLKTLPQE
jgi:putative addiction module killer protein